MIDFKSIIAGSKLYNFHAHTQFCDGHAPMEDFIVEAIAQGFTDFGFSPHSPVTFETSCNMSRDSVDDYLKEIERLRAKYSSKINIYASMEIDYTNELGPADPYFQNIPLDYRIGSLHYIPSFDNSNEYVDIDGSPEHFKIKMKKYFHEDVEAVIKSFYAQSFKMIEHGGFDIIGHFDKVGYNASTYREGVDEEPWYDQLVIDTFEAIMDYHYIVEINTKSWVPRNRFFPNLKYFGMLKKYNAPVVFNSDSHYPTMIDAGREEAMKLYDML
jgi:histidinol-phosphatase (PHP family)